MPFHEKLGDVCLKRLLLCWEFACELNKYCPSGKSNAILGVNRSLASPGINFSASINNNFFMSNMHLHCGLNCILV